MAPGPTTVAETPEAHVAPGHATGASMEALAYTCALDICAEPSDAVDLAKSLLKDVRKSGLKSPFSESLLKRLALAQWAKRDRPRPARIDTRDPKESAVLLFFYNAWDATYEDLGVVLNLPPDRSRHLVHKARMDRIATLTRIPIPTPTCRKPRELLSDYREHLLDRETFDQVADHIRTCRDCASLDREMENLLSALKPALAEVPAELARKDAGRPSLAFYLEGLSRQKRRLGIAFLALGIGLGAIEFNPTLSAAADDQMDRMGVVFSRFRNRAERRMEDMRVLRALAVGTLEGRTEELGQTLDEYINAGPRAQTTPVQNKQTPAAVSEPERSPNELRGAQSPEPTKGSLSPRKP